jgi:hypothetical protein
MNQEIIGIMSVHAIGSVHFGHADLGRIIERASGTREMTTLRKVPTTNPKMPTTHSTSTTGNLAVSALLVTTFRIKREEPLESIKASPNSGWP